MDGQAHIPSVNVDYAQTKCAVYVAKDLDHAKELIKEHGGDMFHDISLDKLVVIAGPDKCRNGQVDLPISED